ncbi:MAG: hypothetical protein HY200_08335 [Nitrospirae bacterium]|nr:hypothetical protein [Nitrospirota bacterium]MBI3594951.1 hypothetical protein [Nitrospirota bacterium]
MSFKGKFYLHFFLVMTLAVIVIDQIFGKLYIRYMILFTSTFFLLGMQYGQRSEKRWLSQMKEHRNRNQKPLS